MNILYKTTTIILLSLTLMRTACADDALVVLSPRQSPTDLEQQVTTVLNLFTQQLDLGDKLVVIEGEHGQTIATLSVPTEAAHGSQRSRVNRNKAEIAKLGQFIKAASLDGHIAGTVHLPNVLDEMSRYYPDIANILIMASPRFDIEGLPDAVKQGETILADSNIINTASQSIFGTKGIEARLEKRRIHWWVTHPIQNDIHRRAAERFNVLYLQHQGAKIVSFTPDKAVFINHFTQRKAPLPLSYQLRLDEEITSKQVSHHPLFDSDTTRQALQKSVLKQPQFIELGIAWQGASVDLDVYATTDTRHPPVYYANNQTATAVHEKDVLRGASGAAFLYETITFKQAVAVCDVMIGINHYGGRIAQSINGKLRIKIGNDIYETAFDINNKAGNKGKDMAAVLSRGYGSDYSLRYTLAQVLGLSTKESCEV